MLSTNHLPEILNLNSLKLGINMSITPSYEEEIKAYFARKTGGDMTMYVKPTTSEETLEVLKLLTKREPINALIGKPVDETKTGVFAFYIGFKFHLINKYFDSDAWMKVSYNKGCQEALLFLINKHQDTNQKKWIQLCLIAREKQFPFTEKYFTHNLVHMLVSMIHMIEHGETKLLLVFIDICYEQRDLVSLMLLLHLSVTNKVVLTDELKNALRVKLDKLSDVFPETGTSKPGPVVNPVGSSSPADSPEESSEESDEESSEESPEESSEESDDQSTKPSVIIQALREKFGL
jgi:hypothetical protein